MTAVAASSGLSTLPYCPIGIHVHDCIGTPSYYILVFYQKEMAETQLSWDGLLLFVIGEYSYSHVRLPEVIEQKLQQALAGT